MQEQVAHRVEDKLLFQMMCRAKIFILGCMGKYCGRKQLSENFDRMKKRYFMIVSSTKTEQQYI
jgi:hypothetical protein